MPPTMWGMGQDDADQGCGHDWVLRELAVVREPGRYVPALARVLECSRCDATTVEVPQPDPNRPRL